MKLIKVMLSLFQAWGILGFLWSMWSPRGNDRANETVCHLAAGLFLWALDDRETASASFPPSSFGTRFVDVPNTVLFHLSSKLVSVVCPSFFILTVLWGRLGWESKTGPTSPSRHPGEMGTRVFQILKSNSNPVDIHCWHPPHVWEWAVSLESGVMS